MYINSSETHQGTDRAISRPLERGIRFTFLHDKISLPYLHSLCIGLSYASETCQGTDRAVSRPLERGIRFSFLHDKISLPYLHSLCIE